jgi:hypothetical protein
MRHCGRKREALNIWCRRLEGERAYLGDTGVDGRIILKCSLKE